MFSANGFGEHPSQSTPQCDDFVGLAVPCTSGRRGHVFDVLLEMRERSRNFRSAKRP